MSNGIGAQELFCLLGFVPIIGIALLVMASIRIVPENQRLAVYRLGRYLGDKGPGLVILIPFVDRGKMIDLREPQSDRRDAADLRDATGVARTAFFRDGQVEIRGRTWDAVSDASIPAGSQVRVRRVIVEVERVG